MYLIIAIFHWQMDDDNTIIGSQSITIFTINHNFYDQLNNCPSFTEALYRPFSLMSSMIMFSVYSCKFLPRAHAQGVKQSVCMSVVVIVVIVVCTKIASLGVLGP